MSPRHGQDFTPHSCCDIQVPCNSLALPPAYRSRRISVHMSTADATNLLPLPCKRSRPYSAAVLRHADQIGVRSRRTVTPGTIRKVLPLKRRVRHQGIFKKAMPASVPWTRVIPPGMVGQQGMHQVAVIAQRRARLPQNESEVVNNSTPPPPA